MVNVKAEETFLIIQLTQLVILSLVTFSELSKP